MKKLLSLLLLGIVTLCGCVRHYTIITNGGGQLAARGKPRLEHGVYVYTNSRGQKTSVPAGRVQEISPSSMVDDKSSSDFGARK
ncbi:MAG TPA: YgdI/YgdR family lipoprotein [Candidatus Paceibacterota bacterium]|nr:YgdI/YgdR family lipoprotein [Candidatus Paceibacterota bacterium]